MTNQVVLNTGALTGIGRATAVAFANKGAKVVVSRQSSFAPTFRTKTRSATSSTKLSRDSAASTSQ
jgi:NAD(P)-dependent dehydrogenase (short-subunit alcohol dehydrogenase family)